MLRFLRSVQNVSLAFMGILIEILAVQNCSKRLPQRKTPRHHKVLYLKKSYFKNNKK